MKRFTQVLQLFSIVLVLQAFAPRDVHAALPPATKRELSKLSRSLRTVNSLVRKKDVDAAEAVIKTVEDKLTELKIEDEERDRSYTALKSALVRARNAIPASFEKDVASIIKGKCLRCHRETRPQANLRLDSYANMGKGGRSGPLLLPGNPQRSLIMARLTADADQRMPKGGARLSDKELTTIGRWISGGAKFDGVNRDDMIGASLTPKKPPVKVVMADGSETVSFKDDVAPWMVNVCLRCHRGNSPRGGLNITTFESLLAGGDTGDTIVPGDPDSSYIVDLVLRQDPLKMPVGNQVNIKRSQAMALARWIREGAHFDGVDPQATLRSLVPTAAEIESAKLTTMSDRDFQERRIEQAKSIWKRVAPREDAIASSANNLYVYGNASSDRLEQFATWGEEQISRLRTKYKQSDESNIWRGRLIVFVAKTRFDYEEFNTVLQKRSTPKFVSGHTVVTANFDTAYISLHDVGDSGTAESLNANQLLNSLLAQAYLTRSGNSLPDWLRHGFGLLESEADPKSAYLRRMPQAARRSVSTVTDPVALFENGTFFPDEVGPVGLLLTHFLANDGGRENFEQFLGALQAGSPMLDAIQKSYNKSPRQIAQAFLAKLSKR